VKVVDSTLLIGMLRGESGAVEKASALDEEGSAATTAINIYEVAYGIRSKAKDSSRRMNALERLLSNLEILPLDGGSAMRAAEISRVLEAKGESISPFDALIAGITLENGAECLVTRNTTHFRRVKGLKVESY